MDAVPAGYGHLREALSRARRRVLLLAALEALALAAAASCLIGLLGTAGAWIWQSPPSVFRLVLLLALLALWLAALVLGGGRTVTRGGLAEQPLARRIGRLDPTLDSDAVSALELYPEVGRAEPGPGRALVRALIKSVGRRARALNLEAMFPAQRFKRFGAIAAASAVMYLGAALLAPASVAAVWQGIFRPLAPAPTATARDLSSLLGDFEVVQRYPAHTRLAPKTVTGADANLLVPAGTRVRVSASSSRELRSGEVRLPGGQRQGLALLDGGRRIQAEFVALESGTYRMAAEGEDGQDYEESRGHLLELIPDRAPRIEILEPAGDVEVRDTERVEIRFKATDDYGVGRVALVYRREGMQGAGEEQRIELAHYERAPKRVSGARPFELASIDLRPGDRIRYFLEAFDEDSLGGPKAGTSVTREIKVFSPRERHGRFLADQERVWEAAIKLLADVLEQELDLDPKAELPDAKAPGALLERLRELQAEVEALLEAQQEDPLRDDVADRAWERFSRQLRWLARTGARSLKGASGAVLSRRYLGFLEQLDPELEKQVLALADALDRQRYDQALASAEGLAQAKQRLQELMQRLAAENDPELRRQILEEIARLKRQLAAVMAEMARTARGIPDEFISPDALEARDMMSMLGQLEQALAEGDIERAMQMLESFSRQIDSTLAMLEQGRMSLADAKFGEMFEKMERLSEDIAALEGEERELSQRLDDLRGEYRQAAEQELGRRGEQVRRQLAELSQQLLEDVTRLARQAGDTAPNPMSSARERAALLESELSVDAFAEAEETARGTAGDLRTVEDVAARLASGIARRFPVFENEAQRLETEAEVSQLAGVAQAAGAAAGVADQIADLLARIQPRPPEQVLSRRQRGRAEQLQQRQAEASQQCQGLGSRMSRLMSEMPGLGHQPASELGQAGLEMRSAEQQLEGLGLRPAQGSMERAVDRLARARGALEQARQAMRSGARSGGRVGHRRDRRERVAIPQPEDYRVPKEFREDLLEAMKRPAPEDYEDQVKRYYEELVK